jgi:hypothetical protein
MHWVITLYNLVPGASREEYLRFERRVLARYAEYVRSRGSYYIGLYDLDSRKRSTAPIPWREIPYAYAAVYLVDEESAASKALDMHQPRPDDITRMVAEMRTFSDGHDSVRLELRPIVPSPFAYELLVFAERMLRVVLFEPGAGKTEEDLVRFETRITARYSEFESLHDWYYTGTYRVEGMPDFTWAEVDVVEGESPEEALARDAEMITPPDVQAIYNECSTFYSQEKPRTALWLRPLVPSPSAEVGLVLAARPVPAL